jgi:DNA repair exonuclease SbcCD nuclease subunit
MLCSPPEQAASRIESCGLKFDYICLGGNDLFLDISSQGIPGAYSGSPERLGFDKVEAGYLAEIEIDDNNNATINKHQIGAFVWEQMEIQANEFAASEDLIQRLEQIASPDKLLRVKLSGLALFESSLNPKLVQKEMESHFVYLDIIDEIKVLPDNISEVKVSEKTVLGQYIKLMAQELQEVDEEAKERYEKSLRTGYTLLQGRESW